MPFVFKADKSCREAGAKQFIISFDSPYNPYKGIRLFKNADWPTFALIKRHIIYDGIKHSGNLFGNG